MQRRVVTSADGTAIHMHQIRPGGGTPLLMLHGVGRAGRTFAALATSLPARFDVWAIDFRGHGSSGEADKSYLVADYVPDAAAALQSFDGPAVVYGHSLGSLVAAAVAGECAALVSAVILEDPPSADYWGQLGETAYYPTFLAMRKWAGRSDCSLQELTAGFGSEVVRTFDNGAVHRISDLRDPVSLRFSASCVRDLDPMVMECIISRDWLEGYDYRTVFANVRCPALLLRGDPACGGMLSATAAAELSQLMRESVTADFPAAGHLLHWQSLSQVAVHCSAFLETIDS